jgi:uncharacterized protein
MYARIAKLPKELSFFLFGPRATGKTTLLKQVFDFDSKNPEASPIFFLDLLNDETYWKFQNSPHAFLAILKALPEHIKIVAVDEVQRVPALLNVVQEAMSWQRFQFALTGSSARKLKRGAANLLGGRAVNRVLWPLLAMETEQKWTDKNEMSQQHMQWGGLPLVVNAKTDALKTELLDAYVTSYLAEEIVAEQLVRNLTPFRNFLAIAGQMNGKIINLRKIAEDIGSNHTTVGTYFEILSDTLLGFALPAYEASVRKRLKKKSKFYLFDSGVKRALCRQLLSPLTPSTGQFGECFEHIVVLEIKALCQYLKPHWQLFFLQTQAGNEIDLLIDTGEGLPILIEIKSTFDISRVNLTQELKLISEIDHSMAYVLSQDPHIQKILGTEVLAMHWFEGIKRIFGLF